MKRIAVQLRAELMLLARNGEQLLLTFVIPILLLSFFGSVDVLPSGDVEPIQFLVPGVIAVAIMSSAMVSLGIATGFERSYLVLKRLGATPLTRGQLVVSKILSVFCVQVIQVAALLSLGLFLGWEPAGNQWPLAIVAVLGGTSAFAGIGLILAMRCASRHRPHTQCQNPVSGKIRRAQTGLPLPPRTSNKFCRRDWRLSRTKRW